MDTQSVQIKNYGVIEGYRNTDYWAGAIGSTLPFEERNPLGDWRAFLPPGEWQKSDNGDSMSCVSFAILNSIETQQKFLTGEQENYSDRFLAKMSETTRVGNYLWKVADTLREYGAILEELYPAPERYTWDEYHKEIPAPNLGVFKGEGELWKDSWDVKYEWVDTDKASLIRHLKHAPLVVVLPGHAVLNFFTEKDVVHFFDSYEPWLKVASNVIWAMKVVLYKKDEAVSDDDLLVDIKYLDSGRQVEKLHYALTKIGHGYGIAFGATYDETTRSVVEKTALALLWRGYPTWDFMRHKFWYRGKLVDRALREEINRAVDSRS